MRKNNQQIIEDRISASQEGTIFIINDFCDIASYDSVNRVLNRLLANNTIRRIIPGVFYNPKFSNFLNEYVAPDPNKVAEAIARNFGWSIVPCGETALNMLGLSTQVPSVWQYVSDGNYREYSFNNVKIKFKRTTNKEISKLSYKTALIVQALKVLGQNSIDKNIIYKLSIQLTENEKKIMLNEAKNTTAWVYEIIKVICTNEVEK